jgi:D-arabinose 1-dehydrogenase-like Zn-dependent alcohol dehydrogenase
MTSGMHQCDPTPNVLVASTETAILQAIAMWGGTEVVTSTGAKHVFEAFQVLKFKAIYELGLATPQYYYYTSTVQPNSQFVIAGPSGMDVTNQDQPQHARLELILNSAGEIIQTGVCFITSETFPEAAPLNPTNQPNLR